MNKRDRLKQKKAQRRRNHIRQYREQQRRHERNVEQYPQFVFDRSNCAHVPAAFIEAVMRAAKSIRFGNRALFTPAHQEAFRWIKRVGFVPATELFAGSDPRLRFEFQYGIHMHLGGILFAKLHEQGVLNQFLPYCNTHLVCSQDIHVRFDALLRAKGPRGTIYYSRHRPTIDIDGREYVVGYSRHAMERVAERTTYDPLGYGGSGDAFTYLANQTRYRTIVLDEDGAPQLAAEMFEQCMPQFLSASYAEEMLGVEIEPNSRFHYRLGYAILSCTGQYAVAVTFLAPGMRGTPEYEAVQASGLPAGQRRDLQTRLERTFTLAGMADHLDFSALKWVHDRGVPQVVAMDDSPFGGEYEQHSGDRSLMSCVVIRE